LKYAVRLCYYERAGDEKKLCGQTEEEKCSQEENPFNLSNNFMAKKSLLYASIVVGPSSSLTRSGVSIHEYLNAKKQCNL
jgi:hypothetical protein